MDTRFLNSIQPESAVPNGTSRPRGVSADQFASLVRPGRKRRCSWEGCYQGTIVESLIIRPPIALVAFWHAYKGIIRALRPSGKCRRLCTRHAPLAFFADRSVKLNRITSNGKFFRKTPQRAWKGALSSVVLLWATLGYKVGASGFCELNVLEKLPQLPDPKAANATGCIASSNLSFKYK